VAIGIYVVGYLGLIAVNLLILALFAAMFSVLS
jgi:hypothetical protein